MTIPESIPETVSLDSQTAKDNYDKANLFNNFFHSIFNNSNSLNINTTSETTQCITRINFTEQAVFTVLVNLNPTKATGIDGIGHHVLKNCATALYQPLYYLFKSCMQQECIPREWATHIIIPIYNIKNYTPISLLCNISKVLERIVYIKSSRKNCV